MLTKDYNTILMQLARLAQFERLMHLAANDLAGADLTLEQIRAEQRRFAMEGTDILRPMETLDVPTILAEVNKALHEQMDNQARLDFDSIHAATSTFTAILCRR